ncbi:hypothetical protein [Ruminococcus sp.]|uniref:hypothetical protein n=1 Tax=Ruminococcus sp. TaxID=41978 RepID=UPI00388EA1D9
MACEFLYNPIQEVALNAPILFDTSIPCGRGNVYHENNTGNFTLKGARNNTPCDCNKYAQYQVTFNGNIAIPTGGAVTPIAVAIAVNGEPRLTSRAIYTPAAVEDFGNVTSTAIIKVPKCCCFSLSVDSVPATTDPTVTPAPIIEVQNANFTVTRIA